ncbi:hypothetical protein GX48_06467 [Paracoccidioides brasiliensis]|nr:hypothetical protein GX48_06467 [Paracoccidioides brasiliensis]
MDASGDLDYEYEYDDSATETFYLNLDLTSSNGLIRAPRKRNTSFPATSHDTSTAESSQPPPATPLDSPHSPNLNANENDQQPANASTDPDLETLRHQDQIQIMDLHSDNPIISYRNQIFSCSWVDLVGTEMTFSMPEEHSTLPRLRHHQEYDLISANRVKILGQKANLISGSSTTPKQSSDTQGSAATSTPTATAGDASTPPPPQTTTASTNQARFLERLMNAKRAKGETDVVRTTFSQKRNQNFEAKLQGWAQTGKQMAELEVLNRRVLQGDANALRALEEIYARVEAPPGQPGQGRQMGQVKRGGSSKAEKGGGG